MLSMLIDVFAVLMVVMLRSRVTHPSWRRSLCMRCILATTLAVKLRGRRYQLAHDHQADGWQILVLIAWSHVSCTGERSLLLKRRHARKSGPPASICHCLSTPCGMPFS